MPEADAKEALKPPVKVGLTLPAVYQGRGSYTESPKGARDVHFAMPGSRLKQGESEALFVRPRLITWVWTDYSCSRRSTSRLNCCISTFR
ncbi:hypothetical protein BDP55DRAFT_344175 [Colletotrichum godetiae]|uniref:Uncharacterized protein n=1 Tax=Colletotrichum godetiae TaxID=1209918 RepID=A0AAJ0EXU3_9PEZI|nr:uncharacterized protein BDP55DRAFT_344175 [Colletotrichum godetiae]KAK1690280.1 hypothetical protein BDP55DRAFT_344175 [Colletotrichum godetiae]